MKEIARHEQYKRFKWRKKRINYEHEYEIVSTGSYWFLIFDVYTSSKF